MIRRAQGTDVQQVANLLDQVLAVHAEGRPDIFIPGTRKYTDDELKALFADDSRPVFVWVDDEGIVRGHAFCIFEETKGSNNMHDMLTLYIDDICVDETFRRHHVATDLFEHVKQFAADAGCYHVTLNVWELNDGAMAFYRKMGMQTLKTTLETIL